MDSCPTQAVLPLVGLAAEKVIRDRYRKAFPQYVQRTCERPRTSGLFPVNGHVIRHSRFVIPSRVRHSCFDGSRVLAVTDRGNITFGHSSPRGLEPGIERSTRTISLR
ncbi:MAG: hypothetical protein R6U98_27010 [Pirellulaceae bacterium]